jgi:hypothetical protein
MHRWIAGGFLLLALFVWGSKLAEASRAPRIQLDAETMKAALRTETPEEQGYIDEVLRRVRTGQLPRRLVESVFWWARHKPEHRFQYFRKALRIQAARLGYAAP